MLAPLNQLDFQSISKKKKKKSCGIQFPNFLFYDRAHDGVPENMSCAKRSTCALGHFGILAGYMPAVLNENWKEKTDTTQLAHCP